MSTRPALSRGSGIEPTVVIVSSVHASPNASEMPSISE